MRKALLALSTLGIVIGLSIPANASNAVAIYTTGASNGFQGFTTQAWASDDLTNPNNHQVSDYCNFSINGVGNSVTITITAKATATAHAVPVSTGIYCDVRDQNGVIVHSAALALPGSAASVVSPSGLVFNNGPYRVCSSGSGQWSDTHLFATPLRCQYPNLPI